jgi:NAD(P)-dependent dehydrogenase (short-subunit alcohol dehydrogenase family)
MITKHYGMIACRSQERCFEARDKVIKTILSENPNMQEDEMNSKVFALPGMVLDNPHDLKKYVNGMLMPKLDLLILNAGYIPSGNYTSLGSGWEAGLGDMHLGHFAMLKFLSEMDLVNKISTTVVAVSSDMMRFGGFHDSLLVEKGEGDLKGEITTGIRPTPLPTYAEGFLNAISYVPDYFTFGSYSRVKLANVFFARLVLTIYIYNQPS